MGELRLSPSRLRREGDALAGLPYARHASDHIVTLDSGALMIAFQLQGAAFETADPRYAWLNGILAVGRGERTDTGARQAIFAVG